MALGAGVGCREHAEADEEVCDWVVSPEECQNPADPGGSDPANFRSGGGDGSSGTCVVEDGERPRSMYQCEGSFEISIAFDTLVGDCRKLLGDAECTESHVFGLEVEPYELAAVMACCDAEGTPEDELLVMCSVDMVEQICRSIPRRLQKLIDDDVIKVGKNQARNLRKWLDAHPQDCYDALNRQAGEPGVLERAAWRVNGGDNENWRMLEDFTIIVDNAAVTAATLPIDEDRRIECFDNDYNNTEVFEDVVPVAPGLDHLRSLADAAGDAAIHGPLLGTSRVHGFVGLASSARGCESPRCAALALSEHRDPTWTLTEFELFASGPARVHVDALAFTVERAALRLYGVAPGVRDAEVYAIDVGDAQFLISGASGELPGTRWASNSTPIIMREATHGWTVASFDVTHVDAEGGTWTITVPETRWD